MSEKKTKTFINIEKNQITIRTTKKQTLFNKNNQFIIESDCNGCSFLEKQKDGIHHINRLFKLHNPQDIRDFQNRVISEIEAKEIIRQVIELRGY